jgi:PAS domain S-box-containing protein
MASEISNPLARLRRKAEALAQARLSATSHTTDGDHYLVHELRTYQIELELQNEDLRKAQVEVAAARDRYADLYTFAPNSYVTVGLNGVIEEANLKAAELLGLPRDELLGQRLGRFVEGSEFRRLSAHWKRTANTEGSDRCELRMECARGEVVHAQLESVQVASKDGGRGFQVTITDVSELKRTQVELQEANELLELTIGERSAELKNANEHLHGQIVDRQKAEDALQMVVASIPHYIWQGETDEDGRFRYSYVSPVVAEITGRPPEYFLASAKSHLRIIHPQDRGRAMRFVRSLFDQVAEYQEIEYRINLPDGQTRWVMDTVVARTARPGRLSLSGVSSDITQRKIAEEGKREAEGELEAHRAASLRSDRLRSLGEMAAGIAHELNQPLAGIRGLAEHTLLALERDWESSPETIRKRMNLAVDQVDRMTHIIDHVRLFARESGRPAVSSVDMNDVVTAGVDLLASQFRAYGIFLETHLSDDVPAVLANAYSLEEVILNLLTNARDVLEEESSPERAEDPRVTVRTGLVKDDGRSCVQTKVADNGPGMPEEVLVSVFDPFFTTKGPDKGTGLGLSISKSIVEDAGGTIEIRSIVGQGTTVIIDLPLEDKQELVEDK